MLTLARSVVLLKTGIAIVAAVTIAFAAVFTYQHKQFRKLEWTMESSGVHERVMSLSAAGLGCWTGQKTRSLRLELTTHRTEFEFTAHPIPRLFRCHPRGLVGGTHLPHYSVRPNPRPA
jgi:hypothetical protein